MSLASQITLLGQRVAALMPCETIAFTMAATANAVGTAGFPVKGGTFKIKSVAVKKATAVATGTLNVDVNKNGTTIYSTQGNRPAITSSSTNGIATVSTHATTTVTDGDWITVDVEGTWTGTADPIVVVVRMLRTA